MRFIRLFLVVLIVTLCGGVFGATVGGLTGFATPNALEVLFDVELAAASDDQDAQRAAEASNPGRIEVSASGNRSLLAYGASLGASVGLIVGAMIGLSIGVLDQLILVLSFWRQGVRTRMEKES